MKNVLKIFTIAILTFNAMPLFAVDTTSWISQIKNATSSAEAQKIFIDAVTATTNAPEYASIEQGIKNQAIEDAKKRAGISTPTAKDSSKNDESVATINVSGTIVNDTDSQPVQYVVIHVIGNDNLTSVSDADGKFTLNNVPINAKIRTQIVGYKSTTLDVSKKMEIKIQQENINLDAAVVTADCNGEMINGKCVNLNFDDFENPEEETASDLPIEVQQYECEKDNTKTWKNNACVQKEENNPNTPTDSGNNPDSTDTQQQTETTPTDTRTDEEKAQALAEKKQAFDDAKATEQSRENRMLTAATTAATGIGGMQLAQGLAEQRADKSAAQDMAAYIATMRCSYANGKSVKAGPDEIELPGGNDANLMKLRNEYFALANDLKERKTALGMKAGIESEEILDKAATGLYDDESVGITSGTYSSLYRAQMLGSTTDQEQIDADKKTSKTRVIGGAVAAGVGVVGGVVGNSLINGKLGEKIKELKDKRNSTKENNETINELKAGLKSAGMTNVNKLDLSKFDMTELSDMIHNTDFSSLNLKGQDATKLINTSNSTSLTSSLETLFEQ